MLFEEIVPGINIENSLIEFKGIIAEGKKDDGTPLELGWLKTIAAFANSLGGTMYIGVEDKSHTVVALDHATADKTAMMVHRQIEGRLIPKVDYTIDAIPVPDCTPTRYILRISVGKCSSAPVFVKEGGLFGFYVRSFGRTISGTPELFRDLVLLNDNAPYDTRPTSTPYRPEDYTKLHKLYEAGHQGTGLTEKALQAISFMDGQGHISEGALLFSDNYDGDATRLVATLWPESTKGSSIVLSTETIRGGVLDVVEKAMSFIKGHSANGFRKEGTGQSDYCSYPERAVFEGVINAIAHRNYFMKNSQIEVNMFKDRLEITSPGSLLGVREYKKTKDISTIRPQRRNQVICDILEYCRYMESKGSGFDKIEQDYAGRGESFRPYISTDGDSFTLVLPNLTFQPGVLTEDSIPDIYTDNLPVGKNDLRILGFCYCSPKDAVSIASYLGIKASSYFRRSILDRLVAEGYLLVDRTKSPQTFQANRNKVFLKD